VYQDRDLKDSIEYEYNETDLSKFFVRMYSARMASEILLAMVSFNKRCVVPALIPSNIQS